VPLSVNSHPYTSDQAGLGTSTSVDVLSHPLHLPVTDVLRFRSPLLKPVGAADPR